MHISKPEMKIAIYGLSATGKTAVAKKLTKALGYNIRSCGEAIKAIAREMELVSLSELSLYKHREVDTETKGIAIDSDSNTVIEGRYLNYVLDECEQVFFIELTCSHTERASRINNASPGTKDSVATRDKEYSDHKEKLYANVQPNLKNFISIDTSQLTIAQTVHRIIKEIESLK